MTPPPVFLFCYLQVSTGVKVRVAVDKPINTTQVAALNLSATLMFPKGHGVIDFLQDAVMSSIRDARS